MAKRNDSILNLLTTVPWWVSIIASLSVYVLFAYIVPLIPSQNPLVGGVFKATPAFAPILAIVLLVPAPISAMNAWRKRKLLDNQSNIETIRALSWKEFEELVAEAYRRKGYRVIENYQPGPDGGVDIRLEKNGYLHLVQCKQWRSRKIGVGVVREIYGVMVAEDASSAIVITSGIFTQEAKNFATGKSLDLVDGAQLEMMIGQIQNSGQGGSFEPKQAVSSCPRCGSELVLRTAKKGPRTGTSFYGCSAFPKCRYTQSIDAG
jgi:restriction system protein